ncbi:tape measure protein [Emticicia soli]|uniref:Tape measure protein n=1 Tax=Emticicia soli TaxID=2027878 RepID=A0ABW5JCA7_9BACT
MSNLHFTASIDAAKFNKTLEDIEKRIRGIQESANTSQPWFSAAKIIEASEVIGVLKEVAGSIIKVRGEFQQLEVSFGAMLKSKAEANAMMQDVVQMAAQSPFEFGAIADGAKQLIIFGANAQTATNDLKMLGDIAVGTGMPINDLAAAYGAMRKEGEASKDQLEELAGKGIPIYAELAKTLNVSVDSVKIWAEAGKIGFSEIERAFQGMTAQGGMFGGLMQQQSETLQGAVTKLSNAFGNLFNGVLQGQEGFLASAISASADMVNYFEKSIDSLKVLVAMYGVYKTAVIATSVIQSLSASASAWSTITNAIKSSTIAQQAFNLVAKTNPYALIATIVITAAAALSTFGEETYEIIKATDLLAEATKEIQTEIGKQRDEIASLVSILQNQNIAESVRLEAYEKLKSISPDILRGLDFQTAKTADLTKAVNDYINAAERKITIDANADKLSKVVAQKNDFEQKLLAAKEKLDELEKAPKAPYVYTGFGLDNRRYDESKLQAARNEVKSLTESHTQALTEMIEVRSAFEKAYTATPDEFVKKEIQKFEILRNGLDKTSKQYKVYEDAINRLKESVQTTAGEGKTGKSFAQALAEANTKGNLALVKSLAKTEEDIDLYLKTVQDKKKKIDKSTAEYKKLAKLEDYLKKQQKGSTDTAAPFGSLAYWQAISKKASEVLAKLNPLDKTKQADIAKLQSQKLEADLKAEEASKLIAVKTSEQIFEEKRKQYEQYQQWVAMKGKASADKEYADLLQSGNSYQEYIGSQINNLEVKVSTGTATDKDREALIKLQKEDQRIFEQGLAEKKTQYELYNRWVTFAGKEAADAQFKDLLQSGASYEQYIEGKIGGIKAKQTSGTASTTDLENLVTYQFTLESVSQSFEKYKQQITAAGEKTGTMTEKLALLKEEQEKIGKSDPQKAGFIAEQIVETEKKRKDLIKDFLTENNLNEEKRLAIQKKYDDLRAGLDQEYADKKSAIYQEALNKINLQEQNSLNELNGGYDDKAKDVEKELTAILESKKRGEIIAFIKDYNAELEKMKLVGQAGTNAYNKIGESIEIAKKKLAEIDVDTTREVFNILGQVGQELSNADGNLGKFGKSLAEAAKQANLVFSIIKTGAKTTEIVTSVTGLVLNLISKIINQRKEEQRMQLAYNKAMNDYNILLTERIRLQSIANSNGFTKNYEGQINDTAAALVKATTDYSNAIQAMQNAKGPQLAGKPIFGIWGKEVLAPNVTQRFPDLINAAGELNVELAKSLLNTEALVDEEKVLVENAIKTAEALEKVREQGKSIIQDLVGQISNNLRNALVDAFKSGTSAAEAFGKSVAEIMADVASKLMFDKIMQPVFDRLAKEIDHSLYAPDGDRNVLDDFERYNEYGQEAANAYVEGQKYIRETVKNATGIDPYADIKDKDANTLSGSIKSITEETAGVLAGQMNAIRVTQATNLEVNRGQLLALNKIATNSEFLQHLEILKSIDKKLSSGDGLRSAGLDN